MRSHPFTFGICLFLLIVGCLAAVFLGEQNSKNLTPPRYKVIVIERPGGYPVTCFTNRTGRGFVCFKDLKKN